MPAWRPVSRRELIATLRRLGFQGLYSGGKHEFMVRGCKRRTIGLPDTRTREWLLPIDFRRVAISQ